MGFRRAAPQVPDPRLAGSPCSAPLPTGRHPSYQASTFCNDALLELDSTAQHGAPIGGGTLRAGEYERWPPGYPLTALGWGATDAAAPGVMSPVLRSAELPLVPYSVCNAPDVYAGAVHEPAMLCAGRQLRAWLRKAV